MQPNISLKYFASKTVLPKIIKNLREKYVLAFTLFEKILALASKFPRNVRI